MVPIYCIKIIPVVIGNRKQMPYPFLWHWMRIPSAASNESMLQIIQGDVQIMNLASACYWTVVIFSLYVQTDLALHP